MVQRFLEGPFRDAADLIAAARVHAAAALTLRSALADPDCTLPVHFPFPPLGGQ